MPLADDDIQHIKKQYLCCAPINKFSFTQSGTTPHGTLDYDMQIKVFKNTIEDPLSLKYPARLTYRKAFLRMLIEKSENSGDGEVYDKLYETLANYMIINNDADPMHYLHFLLKQQDADRIILQESKNLISEGTTGLHTWQAGFALAEWCYVNKSKLSDKIVLELGSGTGLTGLSVVSTCSPKRYTFTDGHSSVLDMLVKNVRRNFSEEEETGRETFRTVEWSEESYRTTYRSTDVRIRRLAWSSIQESDGDDGWANPDVLLAADVTYDYSPSGLFALTRALKVFLSRSNALVVIAATVRNDETLAAFFNKLDDCGLSFEDRAVPKPCLFMKFDETPVRILEIFNKG